MPRRKDLLSLSNKNIPALINKELGRLSHLVAPCLQCSSCSASCPLFQTGAKSNPRYIANLLSKGEFEGILDRNDFWWCGACYSCETHCPQGVPLTEVLFRLKNLALHLGKPIPEQILRIGKNLKLGSIQSLNNQLKTRRKKLGLPDLPGPSQDEIKAILKKTGFTKHLDQYNRANDSE